MKSVAVILSGCGVEDGSEINEAVLTLLAIDQHDATYQCFAPDIAQKKVVNHLINEPMAETRNTLIESARIARGDIKSLAQFDATQFDALILPGGFGAAMNLCDFVAQQAACVVLPGVATAVKAMAAAGKPVGFMCIAPVMIPQLYPDTVVLTIGQDKAVAAQIEAMGGRHQACAVDSVVIDKVNKVVSTPAYMLAGRISEAARGINALVDAVLAMA